MAINPNPINVNQLLRDHNIRPNKEYGQNFLEDSEILSSIADAAAIMPFETVVEIGPGLGTLTWHLAQRAASVHCVELDPGMLRILKKTTSTFGNVHLTQGDILKLDPAVVAGTTDYVVVANVPYYITSAIFRHLLGSKHRPKRVILTIQKEVAERICLINEEHSLLSLSVHLYGRPSYIQTIPAEAFNPAPKVDSAVLKVDVYPQPQLPVDEIEPFFRLIKAGFSQKRKTLRNSLSAAMHKKPAEVGDLLLVQQIDPNRRAETLSIEEWQRLIPLFRDQAGNFSQE